MGYYLKNFNWRHFNGIWCQYRWWKLHLIIACIWLLSSYRYLSKSRHDLSSKQSINESKYIPLSFWENRPPRIYVYNISDSDRKLDNVSVWPHASIDFAFERQLQNSSLRVQNIEEADIAFLPIRFVSWYYIPKPYYYINDTKLYLQRNNEFRNYWVTLSNMLANETVRKRVRHFIVFSYVCYLCSFEHIPKDIIILTFERYSVTGAPEDKMTDAGCGMRCIVIPYFTTHSNETVIRKPLNIDKYLEQRHLLSFVGSVNRTNSLVRYRKKILNSLQKLYPHNWAIILTSPNISHEGRQQYGKSKFCLQLPGDTPTRMGFYDSLLEECTPVILESSLFVYEFLFGGLLPIRDAVITIPDSLSMNLTEDSQVLLQILTVASTREATIKRLIAIRFINQYILWDTPIIYHNLSGPVFASLIAINNFAKLTKKKTAYYVYELPEEANIDMLLRQGTQISKMDKIHLNMSAQYPLHNAAFGDMINIGLPSYGNLLANRHLTSQYSLEMILHVRMLHHPRRTPDIKQATVAIIPAYLFLSHWQEKSFVWNSNSVKKLCEKLLSNLTNWSSSKIPHIIAYSDVVFNKPTYPFYNLQLPKNTYLFTLEEPKNSLSLQNQSRFLTVPYPTTVHTFNSLKAHANTPPKFEEHRRYILSYIGRARWPIEFLSQDQLDVKIVKLDSQGWRSINNETFIMETLQVYRQSTFTLQPHGDMGTRRAFYDSLTVGAIPVVFENNKNSYMSLFKGTSQIEKAMVIIPASSELATSNAGKFIVKYLRGLGLKEIVRRRQFIWNHLRRFQYSLVHDEEDALEWALKTVRRLEEKNNTL